MTFVHQIIFRKSILLIQKRYQLNFVQNKITEKLLKHFAGFCHLIFVQYTKPSGSTILKKVKWIETY